MGVLRTALNKNYDHFFQGLDGGGCTAIPMWTRLIKHGREPKVGLHTGLKKGRFHCHVTDRSVASTKCTLL